MPANNELWQVTAAYAGTEPQLVKVLVRADEGAVGAAATTPLSLAVQSPGRAGSGGRGAGAGAGRGPRATPSPASRRKGRGGAATGGGGGRGSKSRSATPDRQPAGRAAKR